MFRRLPFRMPSMAFALFSLMIACGGDEAEETPTPVPPAAHALFLHDISDLGDLDVLFDGEGVTTISPGELTDPIKLDLGEHYIGIRSQGAAATLYEEPYDLAAQTYLIAFTGSTSEGSLGFWTVDQAPPSIGDGEAAVEVVSLFESNALIDVYVGDTLVAQDVSEQSYSSFSLVGAGMYVINIYNAGSDPETTLPSMTKGVEFTEGSASMILLRGEGTELDISIIDVL